MKNKIICSRREFIAYAAAGMGAVACGAPSSTSKEAVSSRPNMLFIFADQMRYCAMGCMGNTYIQTPNLDRLAGEGILFTNAFSATPVCSPYRAQLMTGKYSHTTGVVHNSLKLPNEERCIAEVFKEAGYATGYIGKWHLVGLLDVPEDDIRKRGFVPPGEARQGWDYWAAHEYFHNYYNVCYYRDSPEPVFVEGYEPDVQTDLAIEYMRVNKARPFCLMLSWGPPHPPYEPPEQFAIYDPEKVPLRPNVPGRFHDKAREKISKYYGLVTSLDVNIGRITQAMYELGIADNTILCFTSDHGDMLYSQGQRYKQRPWEESIHIPFIMRFPNRIRANRKKDVLFNSVDVMPTLLGLCNLPIPQGVQGADLSPVILSRRGREPESAYFANTSFWVGGPGRDWRGIRTKHWKFATSTKGDWVLYDIEEDPFEMKNLVRDNKYRSKKEELRKKLKDWIERTGDDFNVGV